jgi:hypothetical protein
VQVQQAVHIGIHEQHHICSSTAITTIGTTQRFELLTVHRGTTVTAIAAVGVDQDAVNEGGHRG